MPKFYFLNYAYNPNTASTNRMLAYIKGLSELGIHTTVIFFLTDSHSCTIGRKYDNISIEYYWDKKFYTNHRILKHLFYIFFLIGFLLRVKSGDRVYMYNMADVLHFLLKKRGVKVYLEKTEHPTIYPLGSKVYRPSVATYLKDCRKVNGLITVSTSLRNYFIENGVDPAKIHIINMIVDSHRFEGLRKKTVGERYIAYCGTVSNSKDGVDDLIRAFSLVHSRIPDIKLYIIGSVPSNREKSSNMELVNELGLNDFVVFTGVVPASEMPQMLKNAAVVALDRPDNLQAQNGFPGKLGEYLLSETPTVVTKVGDIPLFLTDGIDALLAVPSNHEDFASKLIWAIEHPEQGLEIGKKGALLAQKEFNYLTETRKLVEVIFS